MLFQRVESEGLSHYSYLVGDGNAAVVIDPRRDCEVYVELAADAGLAITHVLETHRNEDYAIGSVELAARTGAQVWHADSQLNYQYGKPVSDSQQFSIGRLLIQAMHTPGHTPGSMSYLLHDPAGIPWMVFAGDILFAGDVGRTDLLGTDLTDQLTQLLYDSLFDKLLPLEDHVIVCPAHGAGSACGTNIAERLWTTIGLERRHNPHLQHEDRRSFVAHVKRKLEVPPYFRQMERYNTEGAPILGALPAPPPLAPQEFAALAKDGQVVDARSDLAFGAAHVPGSLSLWIHRLASFAGWFLTHDRPILLVTEPNDVEKAVRQLIRMGYDNIAGVLAGGMLPWLTAGLPSQQIDMITVQELCRRLDEGVAPHILDVRSEGELRSQGSIPDAQHIHLTQLLERMDEVPRDEPIRVFCGSGLRSMIGASLLQRAGRERIAVVLGGLAGWSSVRCPIRP